MAAWRNDGHNIYANINVSPVQLQGDDFGTRYSSLKYAEEFAADIVKIDQTLLRELNGESLIGHGH